MTVRTEEQRARYQASHRDRRRGQREAERREHAAAVLAATAAALEYARARVTERARAQELAELAGECERAAQLLRRLAGPASRQARQRVAIEMSEAGVSQRDIARALGLSETCVRNYLSEQRRARQPSRVRLYTCDSRYRHLASPACIVALGDGSYAHTEAKCE